MNTKMNIARIALLCVAVLTFLVTIGCGSDTQSPPTNTPPPTAKGAKVGGKHDMSRFMSPT